MLAQKDSKPLSEREKIALDRFNELMTRVYSSRSDDRLTKEENAELAMLEVELGL